MEKKINRADGSYLALMVEIEDKDDNSFRSIDIAKKLNISKAAVSHQIGVLQDQGLVVKRPYGKISLTDKGRDVGKLVIKKREAIQTVLEQAGVPSSISKKMPKKCVTISTMTCMNASKIKIINKLF